MQTTLIWHHRMSSGSSFVSLTMLSDKHSMSIFVTRRYMHIVIWIGVHSNLGILTTADLTGLLCSTSSLS